MRGLRRLLLILAVTVSAFGQGYTINTFAGGGLPVNIPGASASFAAVNSVAVDPLGDAFITLVSYNVVLRVDGKTRNVTLLAGNGTIGFSGDNGPATSAQLSNPTSVAVDSLGNVYVADSGNFRVRKIAAGIITTVAGNGSLGFSGDHGPAVNAQLCSVGGAENGSGLAVDSTGNLYIADTCNYRVRKVSGGIITTIAGNGISGFAGDNGSAPAAELVNPVAVATDLSGNIYIADANRVRWISGGNITTLAGGAAAGFGGDLTPAASAQLSGPNGLATDAAGDLFIADTGNSRIREISNGIIMTVAGSASAGFAGDGGSPVAAQLNNPFGVAIDGSNNIFIADYGNSRLREITNGKIGTVAGGGASLGDKGLAISAQLFLPGGVALDAAGNVYIADSDNNRIRKVNAGTSSTISTIAGNGSPGFAGDSGQAVNAQLNNPLGVAIDSSGNVYIADTANQRVRKVANGVITTVAGNGTHGFAGDGGSATSAQLWNPSAVAVDTSGNLYIADTGNNRIREVSAGVITTLAGNGSQGFSGDYGPAVSAQLSAPAAVAVDAAGNVFIGDSLNNRVREVSNGVIATVAGSDGFALGDNGPATKALLGQISGVAVDANDALYISDSANSRIRKVSGGIITTIAGDGTGSFSGDGGPSTSAEVDLPSGLGVDPTGTVYFADTGNHRVRAMFPSGTSCTYVVTPSSFATVAMSGDTLSAGVQAASGCAWAAQSAPGWIAFSGATAGSGNGNVTLAVAPNSGPTRTGIVSIAGITVPVTQLGTGPTPPSITPGGVVNDGSYTAPVAPGSIAAAFGDFLLSSSASFTQYPLPTTLLELSLEYAGGTMVPLFFVSSGQVNFQVPWELAGEQQTTFVAVLNGVSGAPQTVALAPFAPAIFSQNAQGNGQGAILDTNYHLVDSAHPAAAGSTYLQIFCTGLGAVTSPPPTGSPASLTSLSFTTTKPAVTIGNAQVQSSDVTFYGLAPGFVGLYQVNARVPAGTPPGDAIPVKITIGGVTSNTVTIAVQ